MFETPSMRSIHLRGFSFGSTPVVVGRTVRSASRFVQKSVQAGEKSFSLNLNSPWSMRSRQLDSTKFPPSGVNRAFGQRGLPESVVVMPIR